MADERDNCISVVQLLRELDAGVDAHSAWLKNCHRALVCGTPADSDNLSEEAHRLSGFGRWFYAGGRKYLAQWPDLRDKVESTHQQMHGVARELSAACLAGKPVAEANFDAFMDSEIRFRAELGALRSRIMTDVCLVDHLTGAWNRHSMFEKLSDEKERVARNKQSCCLSMMDIDHFKTVNDRHGHAAGDKVLHLVVEEVRGKLRKYDSIFRYGGEEFLLCLPNTSVDNAMLVVDRVREDVQCLRIPITSGDAIGVTASFGVSAIATDQSVEENISAADQALFRAKVGGRNQVCRWGAAGMLNS